MLPSCLSVHSAPSTARQPFVWAALLTTAFLMMACGTTQSEPPVPSESPLTALVEAPPPPEPEVSEPAKTPKKVLVVDPAVLALAQADHTLRMSPPDLAKEIARLTEVEEAAVENPLLLAVALAQTRQPVDTARALGLAQRVLGNNAPEALALHPLARFMESRLLQQRRLEDQVDRQNQQLRDAQRRNEQLNERLEAVRAIERSLTTRPAPAPASPAPDNGANPSRRAP